MFFSFPKDFLTRELLPEVSQHVAWGERMMLCFTTLKPDALVPLHNHPHEQLSVVIEGELTLTIGETTRLMRPRDAAFIPSDVEHSAAAGSCGSVVIDVFSPPREDYKTV